jgi:peptide/nickel transport system substrate-binding protein
MADLSRRDVLKYGAVVGGAAAVSGGLLACGDDDDDGGQQSGTQTAPEEQKKGGTLTIGAAGAGSADTIDAHAVPQGVAFRARGMALYDCLMARKPDFELGSDRALAESAEQDAPDQWTVRLKDGMEWHNGKSITADDVIFSVERMLELEAPGASRLKALKIRRMTKLDPLTVRFELKAPNRLLADFMTPEITYMVPEGYDPKKPVGSGPFKFESFTPGRESVFTRYENYHGGPAFVDAVKIVNYDDDSALVNALLAAQVDGIAGVPPGQADVIKQAGKYELLISEGGAWRPQLMRVDVKPFSDNRVRQAIRLLADREQIVKQALNGYGRIGNDIYGIVDPMYNTDIPQREHDPEQAKSLLRQAGLEGGEVTLTTAQIQPGVNEACQVLAENAREAGLTIKVNKVDQETLYGDQYLKWPFSVDYWTTVPLLAQSVTADGPDSPYNNTHWDDPEWTDLYWKALAEPDDDKVRGMLNRMQEIQHEKGGILLWGFASALSAYSKDVTGFISDDSRGESFNDYEWARASFV